MMSAASVPIPIDKFPLYAIRRGVTLIRSPCFCWNMRIRISHLWIIQFVLPTLGLIRVAHQGLEPDTTPVSARGARGANSRSGLLETVI